MKKAYDQNNKLVDIIESQATNTYFCPVCRKELIRNFGAIKQFYSHEKNVDATDCEIKMKLIIKEDKTIFHQSESNVLSTEFYNKQFDDVEVEMSDYMSEEGYFLTKEQKDIIFSKEDRVKVSALAGSSKTTTLYYYAKSRQHKKILYIVYNRSMKEEAMLTFGKLRNVSVMTLHGLAYSFCGKYYRDKLTLNYGTVDIIKDLKLDWNKDMELAVKVNEMMKCFMLSDAEDFEDLEIFKDDNMRTNILSCSHRLWELKKIYKNTVKIEHDFYLKCFQQSKTDLSNKYDIIMNDEMQDSSYMMFDIIKNANTTGLIVVGDYLQAIYSFRNSVNIMPMFEAKEYKLTTSFRISNNMAHVCNLLVSDFIGDDIKMKGFNSKQTIVDRIDKSKPYVCLCRTNAYIFSEIADALYEDKNKSLFFEGGYQSYNFNNLKDCLFYSQGHQTKNKIFSKFKDYPTMKTFAERTDDIELLSLIRMVEKYGSSIVTIVDGIKNNAVTDKKKADIIFSTCHRAKGMTYSLPVYMSGDHLDVENLYKKKYITPQEELSDKDKENLEKDISEELHIIYVSITRPSGKIEVSDSIKRYLLMRYNHMGHELHNIINNANIINEEEE